MFNKKSRRLRQNLKRFNKKSVDVAKFVKELYVDHGMAYISCNISDYYDIINKHSVEGYEWPNKHFVEFVDDNAQYVPTEYPIVLEICGKELTQKQQTCIEETIADYYALQLGNAQMDLEKNTKESFTLLSCGLIFVALIWFATRGSIAETAWEILLVFLWFFIWEFLDSFVFERGELVERKLEAAQMASMKLTFQKKFEDGPVEPEEEKQILQEIFEDEVIVPSTEWE